MKVLIVFTVIVFLAASESAQPKHASKNEKLAVLIPYRENSEIQSKDLMNKKSWTYKVSGKKSNENIGNDLLESMIMKKVMRKYSEIEDKKTVKRDNNQDNNENSNSEDCDDAKVVAIEKKTCYKNTYKNVLSAFEEALKSQIESYKKCVCQKKKQSKSTNITEVSTTESSVRPKDFEDEEYEENYGVETAQPDNNDSNEKAAHPDNTNLNVSNSDLLVQQALNHQEDIICFHRQYAFMLNKLLDQIPCKKHKRSETPLQKIVKHVERKNNFIEEYRDIDDGSESVEINVDDVSSPKPKPITTTTEKSSRKSNIQTQKSSQENLNEKFFNFLKENLSSLTTTLKPEGFKVKSVQKDSSHKRLVKSPKKLTFKSRKVEEKYESDEVQESKELSQQQFMQQFMELFQKYQTTTDETFPLQSDERAVESSSFLPPRKHAKKTSVRSTVNENSDESTEAFVKLKKRKVEKEPAKSVEISRKSRNSSQDNDQRDSFAEDDDFVQTSKDKEHSRSSHDRRISDDIAKKVSNFARGKLTKKQY